MKQFKEEIQHVIERFEKELFNGEKGEMDIAEMLKYELFKIDEYNIYSLQFDKHEETFSITLVSFGSDEDYPEEQYLETYPIKHYSREFITERIQQYINKIDKE